uniref:Putative secreted protein n=1 Tax=Xenopsylla cheopis TaxID=163159 RepID=A0A6M2DXL8_XENCH
MKGSLGIFVLLFGAVYCVNTSYRLSCPLDADRLPISRFPDDRDCARYFTCDSGLIMHMQCPTEKFWSQSKERCADLKESDCQGAETTHRPTEEPTHRPTEAPTYKPTEKPTEKTTYKPTEQSTWRPTEKPTWYPTEKPTWRPTDKPTHRPTEKPTYKPTEKPTYKPTEGPTYKPTEQSNLAAN